MSSVVAITNDFGHLNRNYLDFKSQLVNATFLNYSTD